MKKKALFLDRDGVINETVKRYNAGYKKYLDDSPFNLNELKINSKIENLFDRAREKGFKIIVITNQPSILKGNFSMQEYEKITSKICNLLKIPRENIFECFHRSPWSQECHCRKPQEGLFLMAKGLHNLNLKKSVMVGDSLTDIIAAKKAGIKKTYYLRRKISPKQIGNQQDELKMIDEKILPTKILNSLNELIPLL